MNKLLIGGAAGALLIAGQAIAARLPDMIAARAADPAVATAVTADPATAPAAPVVSRFDPVVGLDPEGVAGVGPLTEAETARLAVRAMTLSPASLTPAVEQVSLQISAFSEFSNRTPDCENGGWCWEGGPGSMIPFAAGAAIVATAIVVATDDDSDS
ncbi:hypothetical protein [Brevundimonas sp.]|uniref:hypothetical protein n=1 Tax=Brevundimonas sp. TaxID=1871086 RepID=UPI002614A426|nr:hypothetical protein [Brevundimonas sp.]